MMSPRRKKKKHDCCGGGQGASNDELCDIWKKTSSFIHVLQDKNISKQQRKKILQTLNKNQVKGICCLIHNTILTAEELKKMKKKDKGLIKALGSKKISIDKKKEFFGTTKGGGFLDLFFNMKTMRDIGTAVKKTKKKFDYYNRM